jgi:flagellin-like protein
LIRTKNVRNTTKFKRSIKAISPVIATLLMIAIAVVASLVAYAWVMGYMGFTTNNAGKAIQIQSFASSAGTVAGPLVVYLQNVGQGIVDLNPAGSVFVNDVLYPIVDANTGATIVDKITLTEKKTEALTIGDGLGGFYMYTPGTKITIKVVTTSGTFMQQTYPGSSYNPAGPYTVNFVLGTGGLTIDPAGSDIFDAGTVVSITATPDTGYHFLEWIKTGSISISVPSSASTTATINGAGTITATFSTTTPLTHTITASAATNGAISPSGTVTVNDGADQPFTITADPNFHVLDVLVDGSSVGPQVSYTFTNVIANGHTISATFAADLPSQYTIAASASAGGTIDPSGSVLVNSGQNQVFDIAAAAHYHIADVVVDSISVGTPSSYTFTGVTDDHTIAASFDIDTFTITPSAGDNGAISPSTPQIVNYDANSPVFTVTANGDFHILDVKVDGTSVGGNGLTTFQHTITNVQASHTIGATFEQDTPQTATLTITYAGSGTGKVNDGSEDHTGSYTKQYTNGATVTLTPTADAGSIFSSWSGAGSGSPVRTITMNGDQSATITFDTLAPHYVDANTRIHLATMYGTVGSFTNMQTQSGYATLTEADANVNTGIMGGNHGSGTSTVTISGGQMGGEEFTAAGSGRVQSVTFRAASTDNEIARNVKIVITDGSGIILSTGTSEVISVDSNSQERTVSFANPPVVQNGEKYWIMIIPQGDIVVRITSTTTGISKYDSTNSYSSPSNPTDATTGTTDYRILYANINYDNYRLDQEFQFTTVTNYASYTKLQIQTTAFSDSEALSVQYWSTAGSGSWVTLGNLQANYLNEFGVSLAINAYHIRIVDLTTSNDAVSSNWQINYARLV